MLTNFKILSNFGIMMVNRKSNRWFEKYPNTTFAIIIVVAILILDFLSALIFIPENYNSFRSPHPYYHHGLIPKSNDENIWGEKVFKVFTNSLGFKDRTCRVIPKETDKKRILFIGDSYTEGVGMTWEESFVGILDEDLPDIEILNAGVVSYCPKIHYLKTKYLIEKEDLKFDELYVFIDNSDPLNEIAYKDFEPQEENGFTFIKYNLRTYFYNNSYLYYSISNKINSSKRNPVTARWNPVSGTSMLDEFEVESSEFIAATLSWSYTLDYYNKWGKKGLKLAREHMNLLSEMCKENNIDLTVVIYPWPSIIEQRDPYNIQVGFWEKYCTMNNVGFINLYPDFINETSTTEIMKQYFIPGDVHWNTEGNQYVADILLEYMSDNSD